MRDTHLSITEISERVGYASANSFTRAFKKIEHVTPTQYRKAAFIRNIYARRTKLCDGRNFCIGPFSAQNTKPRCFPI